MKISYLLLAICALLLGAAGIKYSLDQQKTMNTLTTLHGGGSLVEENDTGLRKTNATLTSEGAEASKKRADIVATSEKARAWRNESSNKRDEAQGVRDGKQAELDDWNAKKAAADEEAARLKAEYKAAMDKLQDQLRSSLPEFNADDELSTILETIREYVQTNQEEYKKLSAEYEELIIKREAAVKRVAVATVDQAKIQATNKAFVDDYKKNDDEFIVQSVDHHWHFVVFTAPENSGLIIGDSTPLIIKRGTQEIARLSITGVNGTKIIAEYDPKALPAGVQVQEGDIIFREKPLRH